MPYKDKDYNNSVIYYADTKTKTTEFYQLDNLDTKDAYTVFGGSNHPMYTIKTPTKSSKRLLLVKDSYANSFIPFLAQSYREIVVVDPRYFLQDNIDVLQSGGNHRSDVPLQCKYVLQRQFPRNDAQLIIFCPKSHRRFA